MEMKIAVITKEQYESYFKFTFIRNPWERAYSWYKNVMRDENHKRSHNIISQIPFNEFLQLYAGKGLLKPIQLSVGQTTRFQLTASVSGWVQ